MSIINDGIALEQAKNRFVFTKAVANTARKISEDSQNIILYSEAITYITQGIEPQSIKECHRQRHKRKSISDTISYYADSVEDEQVKESVKLTICNCLDGNNLVYKWKDNNMSEYQKSRVRVLTNIILDEINKGV